ncbi:GL20635, partial [Drosophila persimilis]
TLLNPAGIKVTLKTRRNPMKTKCFPAWTLYHRTIPSRAPFRRASALSHPA